MLPCIENWLFILSFYVRHNTSLFNILALLENSWGQTWISEKVWFAKKLNLYLQHPLFKDMSAKWYLICCINSFNWNIDKYAEPKIKIHAKKNQLMQAAVQQIIVWKKYCNQTTHLHQVWLSVYILWSTWRSTLSLENRYPNTFKSINALLCKQRTIEIAYPGISNWAKNVLKQNIL